jgi:hypothetical protein
MTNSKSDHLLGNAEFVTVVDKKKCKNMTTCNDGRCGWRLPRGVRVLYSRNVSLDPWLLGCLYKFLLVEFWRRESGELPARPFLRGFNGEEEKGSSETTRKRKWHLTIFCNCRKGPMDGRFHDLECTNCFATHIVSGFG